MVSTYRTALFVAIAFLLACQFVSLFNLMILHETIPQSAAPKNASLLINTRISSESHPVDYDYDEIFVSFSAHSSYKDKRLFSFTSFANYTSDTVATYGCNLTVALIDPRVPANPYNHRVWFMLESIASFAPYACIVIHTSACQIIPHTDNMPLTPTKLQQTQSTARAIYHRSLPNHRRMMERGQVRVSILETGNYNIESCDNWDANSLYTNVNFWKNEFLDGIDSDMILIVQDDTILCHFFDISLWNGFAYVGAPWDPAKSFDACDAIRGHWRSYAERCSSLQLDAELPESPGICFGNGGLSLRNKRWTIQVLEECPFPWDTNEDIYFSASFNGFRAPLPTSFEASLFSAETIFPDDLLRNFNSTLSPFEIDETIRRLGGSTDIYERMHRNDTYSVTDSNQTFRTIPLFFHKAWEHHDPDILSSEQMKRECKFYQYIDPNQIEKLLTSVK